MEGERGVRARGGGDWVVSKGKRVRGKGKWRVRGREREQGVRGRGPNRSFLWEGLFEGEQGKGVKRARLKKKLDVYRIEREQKVYGRRIGREEEKEEVKRKRRTRFREDDKGRDGGRGSVTGKYGEGLLYSTRV